MLCRSVVLLTILTAAVYSHAQFGSPGSLRAIDDTGTRVALQADLSGSVRDSTGRPVSGARVEVVDQSNGRSAGVAFSNSDGSFLISNLQRGSYEVEASLGTAQARENVSVDGVSQVTLRLDISAASGNAPGSANAISATQANVPGKARKMFQRAEEAFRSAKLGEAFDFVQKALTVCPTYAKALTLRGILSMEKGDTKAAEPDLEKAVQLDYGDDLGFVALGSLYNTEGRFDNALQTLEHGVSLNPKSWQANLEMARAEIGKQDFGAAVRSLDRSEMFAPATVTVTKLFRAEALAGLKDYRGAIDALQEFVNKSPKDPNVPRAQQMLAKLKEISAINQK